MNTVNENKIASLMTKLDGAKQLTALELNNIRFSGNKSAITPSSLRASRNSKKN